jgi:MYXO-CTERM domain-containing protein
MRKTELRTLLWSSLFALVMFAAPTPASAQVAGDSGYMQTQTADDDDGTDWGWLGLLGLAGLLGLRRREHTHVVDRDRVDTTRTTRP